MRGGPVRENVLVYGGPHHGRIVSVHSDTRHVDLPYHIEAPSIREKRPEDRPRAVYRKAGYRRETFVTEIHRSFTMFVPESFTESDIRFYLPSIFNLQYRR